MRYVNAVLDRLPTDLVILFGGIYFFMPILPEPHLVQKAYMISEGVTLAPIDWFDIFVHLLGGVLALLMWRRQRELRREADAKSSLNEDQTDSHSKP